MNSTTMKILMFCACVAMAATSFSAAATNEVHASRLSSIMRTGGVIFAGGKGYVRVVNAQNVVDHAIISNAVDEMQCDLRIRFKVETSEKPVTIGNLAQLQSDASAVVAVAACDGLSAKYIVAPDDGYALVNVRTLAADNADSQVVSKRVTKEVKRAILALLGVASSGMPASVARPARSLKQLDAVMGNAITADSRSALSKVMPLYGIEQYRLMSYKKACLEGLAPKPVNACQQAIWDEVHKIPSNPIKIEFDPKKGR